MVQSGMANRSKSYLDILKDRLNQFESHKPRPFSEKEISQDKINRFRSSGVWKKLSRWFLLKNPLCADPFHTHKDGPVLSQEVHHIHSVFTRWDLKLRADNLSALCVKCHSIISKMERKRLDVVSIFKEKSP